jgi:hypothetical protein
VLKSYLLLVTAMMVAGSAEAEVYKCVGASGATEYSDQPCRAGSSSELLPDHSQLTPQQKHDAQEQAQQQERKAAELENQRATMESGRQRETEPVPVEIEDEAVASGCNDGRILNSNCARTPRDINRANRVRPR